MYREFCITRQSSWLFLFICLVFSTVINAKSNSNNNDLIELGRRIYVEGILPSGKSLQGTRAKSVQVEGDAAACETCHRRSGMGSLEGNIVVPPITGRFLFATDDNRPIALVDPRAPKNVTRAHAPYNEKSFGKALLNGLSVSGRNMNALMPQYALNNKEIKALMAYLHSLSAELSPGITDDKVHFATIVTPDVDPKQSDVMLKMINAAFSQRNAAQENYSGRMRMPLDLIPRTLRNWDLKVWELKGTPDTWNAQLEENYRREPVFAVISGLSNTTWTPFHKFCEQQKLPCMLPSINLPPQQTSFYSLYYSGGLELETKVLAKHLRDLGAKSPKRLVQIYRDNESGHAASHALTEALRDSGIQVIDRLLAGQSLDDTNEALKDLSNEDTVMLWLDPSDLSAVGKAATKLAASAIYASGIFVKDDFSAISKEWLSRLHVVYPYELGDKRQKNVSTLVKWLKTWNLPLVNDRFQSEVFFNLLFLTDLFSQMLDNLYRDYMIERAEDMLSLGSNVSVYPHLSLSRGQRFASKGAYIARFDENGNLAAESEWIVP
ncbi:MAG: ABC transporter substrate-binding protein [Methylococcaceae bacterium]|nr:ABC transporter substrate-binding protein [Methylococcaceae bacterium]